MSTTIEGRCYFYSETGTEGGLWAFQDPRFEHGPELDCESPGCPLRMREQLDADGNGTGRYSNVGTGKRMSERHASYDGLLVLQDGDQLEIRHPDTGEIQYRGPIKLLHQDPYDEHSRDLYGLAIRSLPVIIFSDYPWITLEEWGDFFLNEYPATLTTERELVPPQGARW